MHVLLHLGQCILPFASQHQGELENLFKWHGQSIDILVDGLETAHVSHTFHANYLRALLAGVKETRPPKVVL